MKMRELNGSELAGFIKERQSHQTHSLRGRKLLILRDNPSPVIEKYVSLKVRYGEDIGLTVEDRLVADPAALADAIKSANADPAVAALIVQLPLASATPEETQALLDQIAPEKDVDGLGTRAKFDSATATAINWLLAGYDINLADAKIAIVGRGKLVGAPLARMYADSGYDVTVFHRGSDLADLKNYDVIITATGVPGLITSAMVSPGTVVVDAGTASEKGILKGDVADDLRDRTDLRALTPRLGGVGPLTVATLFEHVLIAARG